MVAWEGEIDKAEFPQIQNFKRRRIAIEGIASHQLMLHGTI
ncbi:hypothetical protein [Enterococcus casseliflavus]|nr:hypothetical protein [Enterococcus casseliflavus]